jgi:ribonuclease E
MAKKSGSKSSRSERRAGRKRAERAVEHGLPTRKAPPPRARAATPEPGSHREGTDRASDAPRAPIAKSGGVPTLVKVLGAALVILIGVYLLSRQRDEALTESKPVPETPLVAASAAPAIEAAAEPSSRLPAPEVTAAPQPEAPEAIVSVTPPTKPVVVAPVVAAPVVSAPSKPKVEKAARAAAPSPAPVAAPAAPAPVAAPAVPVPSPAKPAAPKTPPVDNPY